MRVELASEASLSRFAGSAVVVRPLLACSLTLVHIGVCVVWLLPAVHLSRSWVPCVRMELLLKCAVRPLEIASVRWLGHTCMGAWSKVHVSCVADMGTYKEFLELANGKYSSLFV